MSSRIFHRYYSSPYTTKFTLNAQNNKSSLPLYKNTSFIKPKCISLKSKGNNGLSSLNQSFSNEAIRKFNSYSCVNSYKPPGTENWEPKKIVRYEYLLVASGFMAFLYFSWIFFSSDVNKTDKRFSMKYWISKFLPQKLNPETFTQLQLVYKETLTEDTVLYRFQYPEHTQGVFSNFLTYLGLLEEYDDEKAFAFPTISHVHVKDHTMQILRQYTFIPEVNSPIIKLSPEQTSLDVLNTKDISPFLCFRSSTLDLIVKTYPKGPLSQFLTRVPEGGLVEMRGPYETWKYSPDDYRLISMVAAGTGITPFYQLLQTALKEDHGSCTSFKAGADSASDKTRFSLIYYSNNPGTILLREELDSLQKRFPERLSIQYVVSTLDEKEPSANGSDKSSDELLVGRVHYTQIANHLKANQFNPIDSKVLVCGPDGFVAQVCGHKNPDGSAGPVRAILGHMGLDTSSVVKL